MTITGHRCKCNHHSPYHRLTLDDLRRHEAKHRAHRQAIGRDPKLDVGRGNLDNMIAMLQAEIARRTAVAA